MKNQEVKRFLSRYFKRFEFVLSSDSIVIEESDPKINEKFMEEEFLSWQRDDSESAKKINVLNERKLELLKNSIAEHGNIRKISENFYIINSRYLDCIINKTVPDKNRDIPMNPTLYRNVNPEEEFGIGRFIADQVYHLSSLLNNARVDRVGKEQFQIVATKQLTDTNSISFIHRFTANSPEGALVIAKSIKEQHNGQMRKIWLAAWMIGNEKKKQTFSVSINQLMMTCYPERKSRFSEEETRQFYETVMRMEPATFVLKKKIGTVKRKGQYFDETVNYNISLLKVVAEKALAGSAPHTLLINLFDVTPFPTRKERSRYVGAPIKRTTIEMNAKSIPFATWLQTRINQLTAGGRKEINHHDFQRSALIEAASLQKTNISNPRMANKLILNKLKECVEKKILNKIPKKIEDVVRLQWF